MRLSIATKVFLGFVAVLVCSAAVSAYGVARLHRIGEGLSLLSRPYMPLARAVSTLEAFHKERVRNTDYLLDASDPKARSNFIALDRTYLARAVGERLASAQQLVAGAQRTATDRDVLDRIAVRLDDVAASIADEQKAADVVTARLERTARGPDPALEDAITRFRTAQRGVDYKVRELGRILQDQMNRGVDEAEKQEPAAREELGERAPQARELCDAIVREVDRLTGITEEYLRFARLPKPQLQRADANDIVRELLEFVRPELDSAGVKVSLSLSPGLPRVLADVAQLRQLLLNLPRNAREAMSGGGSLRVTTRATTATVAIEVRDSGPGIPAERLARIFDPFFTTKERGTGLGLAMAQEIAQEHGGQLVCDSVPGRGTAFTLRLPAASLPEQASAPAIASA